MVEDYDDGDVDVDESSMMMTMSGRMLIGCHINVPFQALLLLTV